MELRLPESTCKVSMLGRLKGAAAAWLQGLGAGVTHLPYAELKAQLREHFGGETSAHLRALQRLKQKGDLVEHNTKFAMEAAAASSVMTPLWAKEIYISSLQSSKVKDHLRPFLHLSLQQLLTKALDLEGAFTEDKKKANHQNPDGVQCAACHWWHTPSRGETCKCPQKAQAKPPPKPRVYYTEGAPEHQEDIGEEPHWRAQPR